MFGKILDYEAHDILMQGETKKLISLIKKKLEKGQSVEQIAEDLVEEIDTIQKLMKEHNLL